MADASAYGPWVDADDYRSWVGVTKTAETDTTVTVQVDAWMSVQYGWSTYGGDAVRGWAGIKDGSADWQWSAQVNLGSFSSNTEWSYKKQSWTIQKGHSSKTVTGSAYISGHEGKYSGTVTEAKASITVAAKKSYSVKYNANGGSGAPSDQTKWHGETLKLSSTTPTRNGHTFQGWATSASATTAAYAAGANYTANAAATLYAVWKALTYTISYSANGGTGTTSSQTKTHGTALTLRSNGFTRTGYSFTGWNTKADGSGTTYAASASYTANAAATLYAQWKKNTYQVKYNANGGSGAPSEQTKTYGVDLTLRAGTPTRTGYTFQGWATSASGTVAYHEGGSYTANAAVTLYAVWAKIKYQVTFNGNKPSGASGNVSGVPSAQEKTYGTTLTISSTKPTLGGYTFKGWNTKANGSGTSYASGASYTTNAALALYAQWTLNYTAPKITKLTAVRCDQSGTVADEGVYCKLEAEWTNGSKTVNSVTFSFNNGITASGTISGTKATAQAGSASKNFSVEKSFTVTVAVSDGTSTLKASTILSPAFYTIDFASGGHGVGIGRSAPTTGLAIAMNTEIATTLKMRESNSVAPSIRFATANNDAAANQALIQAHDTGSGAGHNLVVRAGGNFVAGAGEYATNRYGVGDLTTQENAYIGADGIVCIETNANTIENRRTFYFGQTGTLLLANQAGIDTTAENPSAQVATNPISWRDEAGVYIGQLRAIRETDGRIGTALVTRMGTTDTGGIKANTLRLYVDQAGNCTYYVTSPDNFRKAIGIDDEKSTTAADIATAATNFTLNSAEWARYGNVCMVLLNITTANALTAGTNYTVARMADGKRPPTWASAALDPAYAVFGNADIVVAGNVRFRPSANVAAGGRFAITSTYILA